MRDKKGKSHVTVEVEPGGHWSNVRPNERTTDSTLPSNIVQIKGKQNRAPVAEYLPYVQDFVKSSKWGNVGDIQNTGLVLSKSKGYLTREEAEAFKLPRASHSGADYD